MIRAVGKDVASILGYSNTRDALVKHVDEEDKILLNEKTLSQMAAESKSNDSRPLEIHVDEEDKITVDLNRITDSVANRDGISDRRQNPKALIRGFWKFTLATKTKPLP